MPKPTMRDVARLAGVSVATVSAVINGSTTVREHRARRVHEAMEALDYHPDHVARSLRMGRTDVIGMVVPDITNPFFPFVIRGVEDAALAEGYSVILCNSNEDPQQERRHLNTLFSRRVDGVLIACSDASTAYDSLVRRRFPIVFVDRIPQGLTRDAVATDNVDSGYRATLHLIELGHERIGFIAAPVQLSPHAGRLEGFRKAMQECNLPVRKDYVRIGEMSVECGYEAAVELFRMTPLPTAVLASNNRMLLGLMRALADLGIPCPQDCSVVGFGDYVWTEHYSPRLTVVAQQAYEIGCRGVRMLLCKMRSPQNVEHRDKGELVLLPAELRIRESTGPVQHPRDRRVSSSLRHPA